MASKLRWDEHSHEPHAAMLRFTQELLRLRAQEPALRAGEDASQQALPLDADTVALRREAEGISLLVVARLRGEAGECRVDFAASEYSAVLSSEDPQFATDPLRIDVALEEGGALRVGFHRPGAIVLRSTSPRPS